MYAERTRRIRSGFTQLRSCCCSCHKFQKTKETKAIPKMFKPRKIQNCKVCCHEWTHGCFMNIWSKEYRKSKKRRRPEWVKKEVQLLYHHDIVSLVEEHKYSKHSCHESWSNATEVYTKRKPYLDEERLIVYWNSRFSW